MSLAMRDPQLLGAYAGGQLVTNQTKFKQLSIIVPVP